MKKYLFFAAISLSMISCSSNNDDNAEQSKGPRTVTISASTSVGDNVSSRALWNIPTGEYITVTFEKGETFDLYEYNAGHSVFTCTDATTVQSGNFTGTWSTDGSHWAAILPSGAGSVSMAEDGTNTYTLTLPSAQVTRVRKETNSLSGDQYIVSPDKSANIMIAAINNGSTMYQCFLAPICTYLYFATSTSISKVKITASAVTGDNTEKTKGCMAGPVVVKTGNGTYSSAETKGQWQTWEPFVACIKSIEPASSGTTNEITIEGGYTNRTSKGPLYEYVACIYGGNYTNLTFYDVTGGKEATKIASTSENKVNTFSTVKCHYLGQIDKTN